MNKTNLPPHYLFTAEAARFLCLSGRTLEKHRYFGTGPAYSKIGGRVVYALSDLIKWTKSGRRWSTHEQGVDLYPRVSKGERSTSD